MKKVPADVQSLKSASSRKRKTPPKVKVQKANKKTVSFLTLDMERTLAKTSQYAISTIQETSTLLRRVGSREVILTERLGDLYMGKKEITSSALNKHASSEETEEVDELQEYYQRKGQSAINRASMVRGENSMVEDAEDKALVTDEHVVNDDHVQTKRRIADNHDQNFHDSLYQDDTPREELKSQSTQELLLDVLPRQTTKRGIIARQSRIERAAITKIVSNTVITPTPMPEINTGHNSAMFYELVAKNEVPQNTVIDYVEPPYHDISVLWNEDIGQEDFVLPQKDWNTHTLSDEERHVCNDAQSRYEYLHQHRACFHEVYSIEDIIPTITELPSDLHLYLVVTGSALTNCRWSTACTFQTDKEDRSARKLYGVSIGKATIGIQRLMVAGVLMYWYMDHTGSRNIDDVIPSGILRYVLWVKGVSNPTEEAQPRFSSKFIPVYKLTTVALAVRAVINAGVPVAVIPPKPNLQQHMTNEEYQKYYNDRIRTITRDSIKQEEELFSRPNKWVPGLAAGPCLFPYPPQGQVSDFSEVSVTGCLFHEGLRMIQLVNAALIPPGTSPAFSITPSSSSRV